MSEGFKKVGKLPVAKPAKVEHSEAEKVAFALIDNVGEWFLWSGLLREQVPYSEIDAAYQKHVPQTRSGWDPHIERREVNGETYLRAVNGDVMEVPEF